MRIFKRRIKLIKGTRFTSGLFIAVSIMICAGVLFAANMYYDIDTGKVMMGDSTDMTGTTVDIHPSSAVNITAGATSVWKTSSGDLTVQSAGTFTATSTGAMIFGTLGAERMRILTDGKVGIGTSTPATKLDVWGNLQVATGTTPALYVDTATGRVGIGTASPGTLLEVDGGIAGERFVFQGSQGGYANNLVTSPIHTGKQERYAGNSGLSQSKAAYFNAEPSAAITGVRTNDTTFTRSADTWVVDALINQYGFFYTNPNDDVGTWLPITDNATTTITVSGTLPAGCDRVSTSLWSPIAEEFAHGEAGSGTFRGGVFDGESIWLVPYRSSNLVKLNPATGDMTSYAHGKGDNAFGGGVFDGENIWLVPYDSLDIVKVNPTTGAMTSYAHGKGEDAFWGGVFDGENIWLVPYSSSELVKVNPATGAMTSYAHGQGDVAFGGGVFDGESIWLVPFGSSNLVKVNPATGAMTSYAHGKGNYAFRGGVFDGESIWLVPCSSSALVKVNPSDGGMTFYAGAPGNVALVGGVFDGESIWLIPYRASNLIKVNPATGDMISYPHGKGDYAFAGGVFDGENVWWIAYYSDKVVRMRPPRFGRESLFTTGNLNVGETIGAAGVMIQPTSGDAKLTLDPTVVGEADAIVEFIGDITTWQILQKSGIMGDLEGALLFYDGADNEVIIKNTGDITTLGSLQIQGNFAIEEGANRSFGVTPSQSDHGYDLTIYGGNSSTGFGDYNGGDVIIDGGNKMGTGIVGNVKLATTRGNVEIGGNLGIGTSTPATKLDVWGNLQVATGTTPALYVDTATGRIGIGTASPGEKLEVIGNVFLPKTGTSGGAGQKFLSHDMIFQGSGWDSEGPSEVTFDWEIKADYDLDFNEQQLSFSSPDGSTIFSLIEDTFGDKWIRSPYDLYVGTKVLGHTYGGEIQFNQNDLTIQSGTDEPIIFKDAGTENMRITGAGDVGIGTSTPATKLDVWGNLQVATGTTPALYVDTATGRVGIGTSTPTGIFAVATSTGEIVFHVGDDGNVGIGTANPGTLLEVDGRIAGEKFALQGSQGGYVNNLITSPIHTGKQERYAGNTGMGQSKAAYFNAEPSTAITGTRTNDTTFTRSADTWVVDALINQYGFFYTHPNDDVGTWLPITDNATTTITISGTLPAGCDRVSTSLWNPIAEEFAHGKLIPYAFDGGVFDGENIWLVPLDSGDLVKVNPATGDMTSYAHGEGNFAFAGGAFDGESIWLVPSASGNLVKVNPSDGSMIGYSHGQGVSAFAGGVFDGENIWLVPFNSGNLVKVNPSDGSMVSYAHGKGASAFIGGVFDGESIWLVPSNSDYLVKVNPSDGSMVSFLHDQGNVAFAGGVFDGENIWLVPYDSDYLIKVNPSDGSMISYAHNQGANAFQGGVFDGESVWLVPTGSANLIKVNPSDGSMILFAHGKGDYAFCGGVFDGENIWLVPYNSDELVRMRPPRFGRESLFTTGSLTVGGHAAIGDTANVEDDRILNVSETWSSTLEAYGAKINLNLNLSEDSDKPFFGVWGGLSIADTDAQNYTDVLHGGYLIADHAGDGTVDELRGASIFAGSTGDGSVTNLIGAYITSATGNGNVDNMIGVHSVTAPIGGGTVDKFYIYKATHLNVHGGGDVYGYYFEDPFFGGNPTSLYGLYIEEPTAGNLNYSIYSAGGTNYFGGNVGIGTSTPATKLDVWGNLQVATGTTPLLYVNTATGRIGIATSTAEHTFVVVGDSYFDGNTTTTGAAVFQGVSSHTATSTLATTTITRLTVGGTTAPNLFTVTGSGNIAFTNTGTVAITPAGTTAATTTIGAATSSPTVLTGYIASSIYPYVDNTYDLGSAAYRWRVGYFTTTTIGGTITIGTQSITATSSLTVSTGASSDLILTPGTGGSVGIGTTTPEGIFSVATSTGASVFFVGDDGNVGIGTTTPGQKLTVDGTGLFTGHTAFGPDAVINPDYTMSVRESITATTGSDIEGLEVVLFAEPTATSSANYSVNFGQMYTPLTVSENFTGVGIGTVGYFRHSGSGNWALSEGVFGFLTNSGSGSITDARGVYASLMNDGSGSITDAYGLISKVRNTSTGTTTNAYGVYTKLYSSGGGAITNGYGLYVANPSNTATLTNNYGLYIENQTGGTNNYAIYNAGGTNYFAGNVGIGTSTPATKLDVWGNLQVATGTTPLLYVNTATDRVGIGTASPSNFMLEIAGNIGPASTASYSLGKVTNMNTMDQSLSNADASFIGESASDYSGRPVSGVGDVNGDGYDDFIIAADRNDEGTGDDAGQTYLILGKASGWAMDTDLSNVDASFWGEQDSDYSGGDVGGVAGVGDVNGDGYDDFIIGALGNNDGGLDAGQTYLILGKASGWAMDTDLSNADASFIGENAYDYSGGSVSGVGDVNGDGYDDFIIGAKRNDEGIGSDGGQTYLILGKASGWAMDADLSNADASFWGEDGDDLSGDSVSGVGDVNGDGYDDFIIAAPDDEDGGADAGQTYLILGKASGWAMDTDLSNADASFIGESAGDFSGHWAVAGAGDVNGDGYDDFLIGADENDEGTGDDAGQTYLILGKASGWAMDTELGTSSDASFWGENDGDKSGVGVAGAGDVNGDGYDDFIIGAAANDDGGNNLAGQTYLILGKASGWAMDTNLSSADASFLGEDISDESGESVAGVGDVNGDGYDDFIIGAKSDEEGGTSAGQTYLILSNEMQFDSVLARHIEAAESLEAGGIFIHQETISAASQLYLDANKVSILGGLTTLGNLGIGTSSPATKLDVWGNLQVATGTTPLLYVNTATGRVGIGTSTPTGIFAVATSTGALVFHVGDDGNVGIGTATPSEKFTLAGHGNFLQTSGNPVHIGKIKDNATTSLDGATSIFVSGKYAYIAAHDDDGVEILDISDPANPTHVGAITDDATTELDDAHSIFVSGKYAYVAARTDDGVEILDISDPTNPTHVGAITDDDTTELDGATSIYVSGKYAYVASFDDDGVEILDISDPTNPTHVGAITDDDTTELAGANSIYVSGKYAYVAARDDNGVEILDISDPTNPTHVGAITDTTATLLDGAHSIYVSGKYAYVAAYDENGVEILDISDPTNPTHVGKIVDAGPTELNGAYSIYVSGKYAYIAARGDNGVEILDISDPANPTHVGAITDASATELDGASSIYVSGKYAYVTARDDNAVEILDISGIDAPSATIGDLAVGTIDVWENLDVANSVSIRTNLNVGYGGIFSGGETAIDASSTGSTLSVRQRSTGDILNLFDGSTEVLTVLDGGNVGIGASSPSSLLDLQKAGIAKSNLDIFELTNAVGPIDMDGTETSILFNQAYYVESDTKLLLHLDGSDGATSTVDSSLSGHSITFHGAAQLDDAAKKWGTAALLVDGDGDYFTAADSADWDISTNFTIDLWVKHSTTSPADECYISQYESSNYGWKFYYQDETYELRFNIRDGAGSIVDVPYGGEITDTNWHHIALIKVGNEYGIYLDGEQTVYELDSSMATFDGLLYIGAKTANTHEFDGHLDEVRITHGNPFNAAPKSGRTDTIRVPTGAHSVPAEVADAARITIGTETDWTATATSQDAYMAFHTVLDGTVAEKMRITSAGSVGIGTTTPATKLDVWGNLQIATGTTPLLYVNTATGRIGIGTTTPSGLLHLSSTAAQDLFRVDDAGAGDTTPFVIDQDGNVGIGTTTPNALLVASRTSVLVVSSGDTVFNDTFTEASDTTLASHTPDTGTSWTVLIQYGGTPTMKVNAASDIADAQTPATNDGVLYTADATYTSADYQVSVEATNVDSSDDYSVIAARVQDANNMYAYRFSSTLNTYYNRLFKKVDGVWEDAIGSTATVPSNGDTVTLKVLGTTISVEIAGTEVISVTDSDISAAGKAGLGMGAVIIKDGDGDMSVQAFDNFSVTFLEREHTNSLVQFSSDCTNCNVTGTTNVLSIEQLLAASSGAVLNLTGAGTGNLALLDASNASANGLSIDVQSSASSQYALSVTSNNGALTGLYVQADGNVGIGTTSPAAKLDVWGNLQVATGTTPLLYVNTATGRIGIGTASPAAKLEIQVGSTDGVTALLLDQDDADQEVLTIQAVATTGPIINIDIDPTAASSTAIVFDIDAGANFVGTFFDIDDASGNIYTLNTVTAQYDVPVSFNAPGDVALAYDLIMTNTNAAYVTFQGPGYVRTNDPSGNYDLVLSAANQGDVVINDDIEIVGETVFDATTTQIITTTTDTIVVGSATHIVIRGAAETAITVSSTPTITDGVTGQFVILRGASSTAAITLNSEEVLTNSNLQLAVSTRALGDADTLGLLFDGTYWIELWYSDTSNADYAEMYRIVEDVQSGDVVSFVGSSRDADVSPGDVEAAGARGSNNYLKVGKARLGDTDVAGVISAQPAYIIGQEFRGEMQLPVALAGRVPVKISLEAGDVAVGDLLVPSLDLPGYAMRYNEGYLVALNEAVRRSALRKTDGGQTSATGVAGDVATTTTLAESIKIVPIIGIALEDHSGAVTEPEFFETTYKTLQVEFKDDVEMASINWLNAKYKLTSLVQQEQGLLEKAPDATEEQEAVLKIALRTDEVEIRAEYIEAYSSENIVVSYEVISERTERTKNSRYAEVMDDKIMVMLKSGYVNVPEAVKASSLTVVEKDGMLVLQLEVEGGNLAGLDLGIAEDGALVIGKLMAGEIEVGSTNRPTGITIFDTETGRPFCLTIKSGEMQHLEGECEAVESVPYPYAPEAAQNVILSDSSPSHPEPAAEEPQSSTTTEPDISTSTAPTTEETATTTDSTDTATTTEETATTTEPTCEPKTFYLDTDSDGFGNPESSTLTCEQPANYTFDNADCDDANPGINPAAPELCDGIDNNCDGQTDENCDCGTTSCDTSKNLIGQCQNPCNGADGCGTCAPTCACAQGFLDCNGSGNGSDGDGCETAGECPIDSATTTDNE